MQRRLDPAARPGGDKQRLDDVICADRVLVLVWTWLKHDYYFRVFGFTKAWRMYGTYRYFGPKLACLRAMQATLPHTGIHPRRPSGRAGTLLADFGKASRRDEQYATRRLLLEGQEARTHSLLSAAYNRPVAPRIIDKIRRAGNAGVQANACWRTFIRLSSAFRRSTNRAHTGSILRIGPSRKELAQGTWGAVTRSPILKRTE